MAPSIRCAQRTLLALGLLLPLSALAGDWPQFRGPNRDGIAGESRLLTQWPESGPPVLWRARGGKGYSGIVVSGGRAYTQWAEGEGEAAQEYVVALDAATGKEVWRFHSGRAYVDPDGNGDGPRSTPVVDGDRLFTVSGRGNLHALDKNTGKVLWHHDLVTFGGSTGSGGSGSFCSSPLIEGDRLFVEIGGTEKLEAGSASALLPSFDELTGLKTGSAASASGMPAGPKAGSAFAAFDKATGKPLWMTGTDVGGYSAPLALTAAGVRQVVFFSAAGLVSLSPENGRVFWRYPSGTGLNAASPLPLPGDRLFVSNEELGAAVLQMKADGQGGVGIETVWKNRSMMNLYYSSVLVGGHLYGFHRTVLKCLDPATGEERWKDNSFSLGSVISAGNHLVVLSDHGTLGLVEVNPKEFKRVAKAKVLEGLTLTAPALADGRVYLRNHTDEIVCVDLTEKS